MKISSFSFVVFSVSTIALSLVSASASADVVGLWTNQPFQSSSPAFNTFSGISVEVTAEKDGLAGLVDVGMSRVGVVGGADNNRVEFDETLRFDFTSSSVMDASYYVNTTGPSGTNVQGPRSVEIFGLNGLSLGTFSQSGIGSSDLSSLVGNALITAFSLAGSDSAQPSNGFGISSLRVTAVTVPEPSSAFLFVGVGIAAITRRKRKALV